LRVAASLEQRAAWARDLGTVELAHGFAVALREELDLGTEARNLVISAVLAIRVLFARAHWRRGQKERR
jgi:hypothetical protein